MLQYSMYTFGGKLKTHQHRKWFQGETSYPWEDRLERGFLQTFAVLHLWSTKFQIAPESLGRHEKNGFHQRIFVQRVPRLDRIHSATITATDNSNREWNEERVIGESTISARIQYVQKYIYKSPTYNNQTHCTRTRCSFMVTTPLVVSQRTIASSSGATIMVSFFTSSS